MTLFSSKRLCFTASLPCKDNLDKQLIMRNLRVKRVWNKKAMQLLTKKETRRTPKSSSKQVLALELNKEKIQENYHLLSARKLQSCAIPLFDILFFRPRKNFAYKRFLTQEMKNCKYLTSLDLRREGLLQILQSIQTLRNVQDVKITIPTSTLWKYPRFCDHFLGLQSLNLRIAKNNKKPTTPEQNRIFHRFIKNLANLKNLRSVFLRIQGVSVGDDSATLKMIIQAFENHKLDLFGLVYYMTNPILQEDYKPIFGKINSLGLLYADPTENTLLELPPKELLEKENHKTLFLLFGLEIICDLGLVLENSGALKTLSIDSDLFDEAPETVRFPKNLKYLAFKSPKNSEELSRLSSLMSEIKDLDTLSLSASLYEKKFVELSKLPCLWKLKTLKASISCDLGNSKLIFTSVFFQIRQMTNLERLDLIISENFMMLEPSIEMLLSKLVNLKHLRLESSSFRLDREKFSGPLNLPIEKLTKLTELQLVSNNYQLTADNGLSLLKKIQKLENLENVIISGVLLAKTDQTALENIVEQIFSKQGLGGTITGPQNIYKKVDTQNMIVQKADRRAQFY